jgi:hypothetical protein
VTDYDSATRPSRAAWRDRADFRRWTERENANKERRDEIREEYRAQLGTECAHGARRRVIGEQGGEWWAGLACPEGKPNCGIKFLAPSQVYQEWKDSQPEPGS